MSTMMCSWINLWAEMRHPSLTIGCCVFIWKVSKFGSNIVSHNYRDVTLTDSQCNEQQDASFDATDRGSIISRPSRQMSSLFSLPFCHSWTPQTGVAQLGGPSNERPIIGEESGPVGHWTIMGEQGLHRQTVTDLAGRGD